MLKQGHWSILTLLCACVASAVWAEEFHPLQGFPSPDMHVRALELSGDTLYLGGAFSYVATYTGSAILADPISGDPAFSMPHVDGIVNALIADGSGGYFMGGVFTQVGQHACQNIARINANGTVDTQWNGAVEGIGVFDLAVDGQRLLVAGNFDHLNGQPRANLGSLALATGEVSDWAPSTDNMVNALLVKGDTVYILGAFTTINGEVRGGIAACDANTAALLAWNPPVAGTFYDLASYQDQILVAGEFELEEEKEEQGLHYVAMLDQDLGTIVAQGPALDNSVFTIAVHGDLAYLGGDFSHADSMPRKSVVQIDLRDLSVTAWHADADVPKSVYAILPLGETVYMSGPGNPFYGDPPAAAAYSATEGSRLPWNPDPIGIASCLVAVGDKIFIGGKFSKVRGVVREGLAAINTKTGTLLPWAPTVVGEVMALAAVGPQVFAAGQIYAINGSLVGNLVSIDAADDQIVQSDAFWADAAVRCIARQGDALYVGGSFGEIAGEARSGLAKFNLTPLGLDPWAPEVRNGEVDSLALQNGTVYVGGTFQSIAGSLRIHVGAVDAATGLPTGFNPAPDNPVSALLATHQAIYIGRNYDMDGHTPVLALSRVNPSDGTAIPWGTGQETAINGSVKALLPAKDTLYATGNFDTVLGEERFDLAAFDLRNGQLIDWRAQGNPEAGQYCLAAANGKVFVGGNLGMATYPSALNDESITAIAESLLEEFDILDLDGDGVLTWQEVSAKGGTTFNDFEQIDLNHDDHLDQRELEWATHGFTPGLGCIGSLLAPCDGSKQIPAAIPFGDILQLLLGATLMLAVRRWI